MGKITEKLLLEKCTPKNTKLEQVKTLNLSKLGLKSSDLPVPLLSRLRCLEQLDLSGNRLQEMPSGLFLPALRSLDLTNNEMEDVTTLATLTTLEDLRTEDNLYVTVSDNYKLMILLPKLRFYNGKDISTAANHIRYDNSENLRKRVLALWETSFSLPDHRTAEKLAIVERDFVNAVRHKVKYGPSSLTDYTKWRVGFNSGDLMVAHHVAISSSLTNTGTHTLIHPPPLSLQPLHVLQCHSKQDSPDDFSTQLWACSFQPKLDYNGDVNGATRIVATCGGESVCLIDCETGLVMKKYKVPGEEFFSLAWSTVLMSLEGNVGMRPCSILAAGGKRGLVKLLHPRANMAYGEFRASRKALSILRFSPRQGNLLFTGSYDKNILMWDIGGVDSKYNFKVIQLLVLETTSTPLHFCLPPGTPDTHLIAACEEGLHSYNIQLNKDPKKRSEEMEITFPVYEKDKDHDYHTIDGLGFLTDDVVASKTHMQGSIYLWSWKDTRAQWPNNNNKKKEKVCAVILAELQWSSTDIPYLSLNTCPSKGYVVCGDERGRLWTYHVTDLNANFRSGKAIPATEILEWPLPVRKGQGPVEGPAINSVAMDPELRYLVALSDKNMAVVWIRTESS
uniref:Leucine-rich repeat and WD repeat-containing protein 1 n=1 Tax=Hucho hucho TaxID=62062 RepID=A0A4W5JRB3_9TELE